jgi:hypothetical protein
MTRHVPIISAGPVREMADGALRATWQSACSCGWSAGHDYTRHPRAMRAHGMHVQGAQRDAA